MSGCRRNLGFCWGSLYAFEAVCRRGGRKQGHQEGRSQKDQTDSETKTHQESGQKLWGRALNCQGLIFSIFVFGNSYFKSIMMRHNLQDPFIPNRKISMPAPNNYPPSQRVVPTSPVRISQLPPQHHISPPQPRITFNKSQAPPLYIEQGNSHVPAFRDLR